MLAGHYGLSRTTVAKWRSRSGTADAPMGPRERRSTALTPLDDVMGCLRDSIRKLTRSSACVAVSNAMAGPC
ncbi:Integrase (fragment) [Methylocella tundrae]|uniref:Integrase n=1 Tax=Methylocella tundrae TaxID=227605 RepID=A0A8B6M3F9_METTU